MTKLAGAAAEGCGVLVTRLHRRKNLSRDVWESNVVSQKCGFMSTENDKFLVNRLYQPSHPDFYDSMTYSLLIELFQADGPRAFVYPMLFQTVGLVDYAFEGNPCLHQGAPVHHSIIKRTGLYFLNSHSQLLLVRPTQCRHPILYQR